MRLLLPLVLLGGLLVVGMLVVTALRDTLAGRTGTPALPAARWVAAHHSVDGVTRVAVQRVVGEHPARVVEERVIRRIADDAADYDLQIMEAMALARERASVLDSVE